MQWLFSVVYQNKERAWDLNFGIINFKIYLGSSSQAMADREKKRGRWKYKNLNIFLDEIKNIFQALTNMLKIRRRGFDGAQ